MAVIRLDSDKVERIIAQVLRDEFKMLSAPANAAASKISARLLAAMPDPNHMALQGHRVIPQYGNDRFTDALSALFKQPVNFRLSVEIWKLVYAQGRDLPSDIAGSLSADFWR
jgi:hypothetical protein